MSSVDIITSETGAGGADDGRTTPTSVTEIMLIEKDFTIESIHFNASQGFEYLKEHLNKSSINTADTLDAFYSFDPSSNNHILFKQLFCLSVTMLLSQRDMLNEFNADTYEKVNTYTINMYNSKKSAMY
jgi:hypothetical protein